MQIIIMSSLVPRIEELVLDKGDSGMLRIVSGLRMNCMYYQCVSCLVTMPIHVQRGKGMVVYHIDKFCGDTGGFVQGVPVVKRATSH